MLSDDVRSSPRADPATPPREAHPARRAARAYLAVAAVLFIVAWVSVAHLPWSDNPRNLAFPDKPWLSGWAQWDAGWFKEVAERGYSYIPGQKSSVAFFPAYPLLMRGLGEVTGSVISAGILLTLACGLALAVLFFFWARERLAPEAAWTALLLFLLYPYSYYLAGAVYVEALFILSALGAFLLLERGRPWLAGLAGAVTTATRHVGMLLLVGLVLRTLERRGVMPTRGCDRSEARAWRWRKLRWRDGGVLLTAAGVLGFCLYLWSRFDDPLIFVRAQEHWQVDQGPRTWLKLQFFEDVRDFRSPFAWLVYVSHPIMMVTALAFIPRVFRRFGVAYGVYSLLTITVAALTNINFFGMGRYILPAFPCFAAAGEWLAERRPLRAWVLPASAVTLVVATSFFARGHYLS
jgi:uncharacterized protein YhhL (DUF1145 family)